MAKPIFLIGFPHAADSASILEVQSSLSLKLDGEYHVITYKSMEKTQISFEVLNALNASDIELDRLTKLAGSIIENHEQSPKNNQDEHAQS